MEKIKVNKNLIGNYIRVNFTDIGCVDGICLDIISNDK
jgi:hypothetical protein